MAGRRRLAPVRAGARARPAPGRFGYRPKGGLDRAEPIGQGPVAASRGSVAGDTGAALSRLAMPGDRNRGRAATSRTDAQPDGRPPPGALTPGLRPYHPPA